MSKNVFAGLIVTVLLLIYVGGVGYMVYAVVNYTPPSEQTKAPSQDGIKPVEFNPGWKYAVTMIGGLVSALVIAKLATTEPGGTPAFRVFQTDGREAKSNPYNVWITTAYLLVWLVVGATAFVVGSVLYPAISGTLGDIGTSWIGTAVAAGYSYFGVEPPKPKP